MKILGEPVEVVTQKRYIVQGVRCDWCQKVIEAPSRRIDQMDDKYKYYAVTTGHHDWGNESIESVQHFDICPDCILEFVKNYLLRYASQRSGEIEIKTEHLYFEETEFDRYGR